jgi:hypothetical protein
MRSFRHIVLLASSMALFAVSGFAESSTRTATLFFGRDGESNSGSPSFNFRKDSLCNGIQFSSKCRP